HVAEALDVAAGIGAACFDRAGHVDESPGAFGERVEHCGKEGGSPYGPRVLELEIESESPAAREEHLLKRLLERGFVVGRVARGQRFTDELQVERMPTDDLEDPARQLLRNPAIGWALVGEERDRLLRGEG